MIDCILYYSSLEALCHCGGSSGSFNQYRLIHMDINDTDMLLVGKGENRKQI